MNLTIDNSNLPIVLVAICIFSYISLFISILINYKKEQDEIKERERLIEEGVKN